MFLFATISFDGTIDMAIVRSLIAVSIVGYFKTVQVPRCADFVHFRQGQVPTMDYLMQYLKPHRVPYAEDERALLVVAMHSKQRRKLEMAQNKHEQQSEDSCKVLARYLLSQWPSREVSLSGLGDVPLLHSDAALLAITPEWNRLTDNHELSMHLIIVQTILDTLGPAEASGGLSAAEVEQEFFSCPVASTVRPTMQDLLGKLKRHATVPNGALIGNMARRVSETAHRRLYAGPTMDGDLPLGTTFSAEAPKPASICARYKPQSGPSTLISELQDLVRPFAGSTDQVRRAYGIDLERSIGALERSQSNTDISPEALPQIHISDLEARISSSRASAGSHFNAMRIAMTEADQWSNAGRLLPDITPITLLEMLPTIASIKDLTAARDLVISYGDLIMTLQHLLRIEGARQRTDAIQLADELRYVIHADWKAKDHIDWFLLEIDFNLRIRPDQLEVAKAMISPNTNANFVLQMNMGQGKSSVVIPMVVAQLANAKNLVRVVVPRPLLQ